MPIMGQIFCLTVRERAGTAELTVSPGHSVVFSVRPSQSSRISIAVATREISSTSGNVIFLY